MEEETQNNVIDNDDNSTVETTTEEETIEKDITCLILFLGNSSLIKIKVIDKPLEAPNAVINLPNNKKK